MAICIFAGTFNPIHEAHLKVAEYALEHYGFEKIIFIADKIEHKTRPSSMIDYIEPFLNEENGLNKALLACYKLTIKSLVDRNLKICVNTIDLYNRLLND